MCSADLNFTNVIVHFFTHMNDSIKGHETAHTNALRMISLSFLIIINIICKYYN